MPRTLDPVRSEKLKELILQGVQTEQAMLQAGYSKEYADVHGHSSEALPELIRKTKEIYSVGFTKYTLQGLSGEEASKVLINVVKNGRDFDKIQAIKLINQHMCPTNNNVSSVSNLNVFIIPQERLQCKDWEQKYGKVVEVEPVDK